MVRNRRVVLRETEAFLRRVEHSLPEGVETISDLYRLGARVLFENPDLLFGVSKTSGVSFDQVSLDTLENNIVSEIRENRREVHALRLLIEAIGSVQDSARKNEVVRIVTWLLDSGLRPDSVSKLESSFPYRYWRDYTLEVILELEKRKLIHLEGESIKWM